MQMRQCLVLGSAVLVVAGCDSLGPEQETGRLSVAMSQWLFARIYLDGEDTGHLTPFIFETVPVGQHTVRIGHPQIADSEKTVEIFKDRTTYATFGVTYRPIPLVITSEPPGARILIEGQDTGQETPVTIPATSPLDRDLGVRLLKPDHFPSSALLEFGPADSILTYAAQLTPVPVPTPTIIYAVADTLFETSLDGLTNRPVFIASEPIRKVSRSDSGSMLAVATTPAVMILDRNWSVQTRLELYDLYTFVKEIRWSSSGRYLIIANFTALSLFDAQQGELNRLISGFTHYHSADLSPGDSLVVFLGHYGRSAGWHRWRTDRTGQIVSFDGFETAGVGEDVQTVWVNPTSVLYKLDARGLMELNPVDGTIRTLIADEAAKQLIVSHDRRRFAFLAGSRVYTGPVDLSNTATFDLPEAKKIAWDEQGEAFAYLRLSWRNPTSWHSDLWWRTRDGTHHHIVDTDRVVGAIAITQP